MSEAFKLLAYAGVGFAAICFLFKIALDFVFPYGLCARAARGSKGSVSWLPPVELLALPVAVVLAWAARLDGWFAPSFLAVVGICLVAADWVHFILVMMIAGLLIKPRESSDDAKASESDS